MEKYLTIGCEDVQLSIGFGMNEVIVTVEGRYKTITDGVKRNDNVAAFIGCVFSLENDAEEYVEQCSKAFEGTKQAQPLNCLVDACNILQAIKKLTALVTSGLADSFKENAGDEYSANKFIIDYL